MTHMTDSPIAVSTVPKPLSFIAGRPLTVCALFYGAGVLLGADRPFHWLMALGLAAAVTMAFIWRLLLHGKTAIGFLPAFLFLGIVLSSFSAFPVRPQEGTYQITGTIVGQPRVSEDGQTAAVLGDVTVDGKLLHASLYWTSTFRDGGPTKKIENGNIVSFTGTIYHPSGLKNPHGFDFDLYLKQRGIIAGVYGRENLMVTPPASPFAGSPAYNLRSTLTRALYDTMGKNAALASVMLLGSSDQLPEEAREDFRITGTAHILSISGLHVAYIAAMVIWLLKLLHLPPKVRFFALAAFLAAYSWLVGLSPPVIRSSLMLLFYMGAKLNGQAHDPLTSISAAFLVLLIINPLDLLSPGFQLSFGAVTGMLMIGDPLLNLQNRFLPGKKPRSHGLIRQYLHKQWQSIKTMPALGLAAQIGVMFPLAAWYNELSILGIFVNLLVIPYTAVLMLAYILALALSPLGIIGHIAGGAASFMTDILLHTVSLAAKVPGMAIQVSSPTWPVILGDITLLLLLSPYVLCRGKRRIAMLALTLILTFCGSYVLENKDVRYTQLSVGDADAAILEDGSFTAVIDTGETGAEVIDYLRGEGRDIDALFLSHLHMDHAGGIEALLQDGIAIRKVYVSDGAEKAATDSEGLQKLSLLREAGIPVEELHTGDVIKSSRTSFTVLWPKEDSIRPGQDANQTSLVMVLQMDGASLLTTGDITDEYEDYSAANADILKVAHHGSAGSTSAEYLKAVSPQVAILSCSGTYKHPALQALDRLNGQQIPMYRTDESGAVAVTVHGQKITIMPFIKE